MYKLSFLEHFYFPEKYEVYYDFSRLMLCDFFKEFTQDTFENCHQNNRFFSKFYECLFAFFIQDLFWKKYNKKVNLKRNIRCFYDEMDVIVEFEEDKTLFFFEIKSQKKSSPSFDAWDRITHLKIHKSKRFIQHYLSVFDSFEVIDSRFFCVSCSFQGFKTKREKLFSVCQISLWELEE